MFSASPALLKVACRVNDLVTRRFSFCSRLLIAGFLYQKHCKTGVLIKAILAELDKDWWEYIPEDAQEAVEEDEIGIEATI